MNVALCFYCCSFMYGQTCIRPNINLAVEMLNQHESYFGNDYCKLTRQVSRYLKEIRNDVFTY